MDRNGVKMAYCSSELSRGVCLSLSLSLSLFLSIHPSLSHPISDELLKFACGSSWPKLHEKLCQLLGDFLDLTVGNSSVSAMLCTRTLSTDAALLSSSSTACWDPQLRVQHAGASTLNPSSAGSSGKDKTSSAMNRLHMTRHSPKSKAPVIRGPAKRGPALRVSEATF